jgi:hypothetical protein
MEAELYCLSRDVERAGYVGELLRRTIDDSLVISVRDLQHGGTLERDPIAYRYTQLLQATIPPEKGLHLTVSTMDFYRDRIYLGIYWPIYVQGYWSEIAGTSVYFEGYSLNRRVTCYPALGDAATAPERRGLELFFPALAVRGRMVMVPKGQAELLDQIGAPPLGMSQELPRDVLEVDFYDDAELREATERVARSTLAEVAQDLHSHVRQFPSETLDVGDVAAKLEVTPAILQHVIAEDVVPLYSLLTCDLERHDFALGRWTKTGIRVGNGSDTSLEQVMVTVSGPVEARPSSIYVDVPARGDVTAEIALRPSDPGDIPLEIALVLHDHQALSEWLPPPEPVWVTSSGGAGRGDR